MQVQNLMYIDIDYIKNRAKLSDLIDLTREKDDAEEINNDRINAIITDASAIMDNAAEAAGYIVPIENPDDFIKRIVYDLALYLLYARKYDDEEMKDVYVRYNKAYSVVNSIASGEKKLSCAMKAKSPCEVIYTNKSISDRVFTQEKLRSLQ